VLSRYFGAYVTETPIACRASQCQTQVQFFAATPVLITLNGESFELDQPLSVEELLQRLEIDPRRVAVEHNLVILRRHAFAATLVGDGDRLEIVNFVGGG
jgi:sulfur carrier protein